MFTRALKQCSNEKRRFFGENQHIFVHRLPIDFFYFANFRWSFFGKIIGQKQQKPLLKLNNVAQALFLCF